MHACNDSNNAMKQHSSNGTSKASLFGWTFANACILGMTAWFAFSSGTSSFAKHAEAAPPPASALNKGSAGDAVQAFDAGSQRAEMTNELRAMRQEMAEMRALLSSGRIRAEIANMGELRAAIESAKTR